MTASPEDLPLSEPAAAPLPRSMASHGVGGRVMAVRALGLPRRFGEDAFHRIMGMGWWRLVGLFTGVFLAFNLVFATLYWLDPTGLVVTRDMGGIAPFWRDFFFSVHTVATIGYGNIYPASTYANVVVVAEITLGIVYFALATGMAFARFSRPTARILFSRVMVLREMDGVPTLMLRAANQRHNMIYSAEARLSLLVDAEVGGVRMRRFVDLPLARSSNPTFALTWTLLHPIDGDSPLAQWVRNESALDIEIVVLLSGVDEVSGQAIHGRWAYGGDDVRRGGRFADILGVAEDGARTVDYTRFHEVLEG